MQREIHVEAEDLVFPVRNGITHTGQFQVLSTHSLSRFMGWMEEDRTPTITCTWHEEGKKHIFGVNGIESSAKVYSGAE